MSAQRPLPSFATIVRRARRASLSPDTGAAFLDKPWSRLQCILHVRSRLEFTGTHELDPSFAHCEHPTEQFCAFEWMYGFAGGDGQAKRSKIPVKIASV